MAGQTPTANTKDIHTDGQKNMVQKATWALGTKNLTYSHSHDNNTAGIKTKYQYIQTIKYILKLLRNGCCNQMNKQYISISKLTILENHCIII